MTDDDPPGYYAARDVFASAAASIDQINKQVRNHPDVQRLYAEAIEQINRQVRSHPDLQRQYSDRLDRINQQVRIHRALTDREYFETIKQINAQLHRLGARLQRTDEIDALDPDVRVLLPLFDRVGVPRPPVLPRQT